MANKRAFIVSMIFSIAVHLMFIFGSAWLHFATANKPLDRDKKKFNVKIAAEKKYSIGQSTVGGTGNGSTPPTQAPEVLHFEQPKYDESLKSFTKQEIDSAQKEELASMSEDNKPQPLTTAVLGYSKQTGDSPKDVGLLKQREQRRAEENLVDIGKIAGKDALDAPGNLTDEVASAEFVDKMPGITPSLIESYPTGDDISRKQTAELAGQLGNYQPVISASTGYGSLGQHLLWTLATYEDPADHEKYFRLSIRANPNSSIEDLPTIPKEVILLVDCSVSIEEGRLNEFKEGISYILNKLNPEDRFNVIAFKETLLPFKRRSVVKDANEIEAAIRFVGDLTAGEKTDTYQALSQTVSSTKTLKPAYIVLLSDGRPTQGITNSTRLINSISEGNKGEISIFAFSGGIGVNRYLLDFISYKNRGWAEHSYRAHLINENLAKLYDKIRDPIVMNLRYQVNGLPETDLFPKILPDFFRNTELVLYGKYEKAQPIVFRLLGDIKGTTHEFLVETDIATAPQGSADIAKGWAFNRIYDLISQMKYRQDNGAILNEIKELSEKFKMETPYLDYLKE